jgi:hypothetical protein
MIYIYISLQPQFYYSSCLDFHSTCKLTGSGAPQGGQQNFRFKPFGHPLPFLSCSIEVWDERVKEDFGTVGFYESLAIVRKPSAQSVPQGIVKQSLMFQLPNVPALAKSRCNVLASYRFQCRE